MKTSNKESETTSLVFPERIENWTITALQHSGVGAKDAKLVAQALIQTSLWGIDTHGIARLPHYLERIRYKSIKAAPNINIQRTGGATISVDGDNGLGIVVCNTAMEQASQCAQECGVGIAGCYHSSHCGAIGMYTRQAASYGLVGIALTHSDSFVAPHNGREAFLGTNPISIAVPSSASEPVCLDMATSQIPFNQVMNARREGNELPENAAIDATGQPTSDPDAASTLLPLAGHKGYALGFMIDVLCRPLNGMPFGPNITKMYEDLDKYRNLGSLMIAIDPHRFHGGEFFEEKIASMVVAARNAPAQDDNAIMAPGDPQYAMERERRISGIPVEKGLLKELTQWSDILGISKPF